MPDTIENIKAASIQDQEAAKAQETPATNPRKLNLGVAFLPFSPVSFSEPGHTMIAYIRLGVYTITGIALWEKHRKFSYAALGAAGLSLITSLTAGNLNK